MTALLTPDEVRDYLQDYPEVNLLLDTSEFGNGNIQLCISLAMDEFNTIPPFTSYNLETFMSKSILLQGTLWQLFQGRAAVAVRNTLSYTDGGLQIPIEEKYEMYKDLAGTHKALFEQAATKLKIYLNMESGWGEVRSDEAAFPIW